MKNKLYSQLLHILSQEWVKKFNLCQILYKITNNWMTMNNKNLTLLYLQKLKIKF